MSTSQHVTRLVAGRYRLGSLLGQGAMGRVWAAHDEVLDREVAVKEVLVPAAVPDAERDALVARTLREGRAAARVRHPRVVTVYDVVEDDDRPWLVLQRLEPRTLADVLVTEGPLDPARAAVIGLQVLEGLAAVHAAGVLHRDVKPGNVLFGPDGGAVLADFGVATLEDDAAVTSTGLVLGSPAYLAPERARGEAPTAAADLWSLGATLFAAVEGRSPFHREGPLPTLGALLTQDVPAAPAAGPLAPAIAALLTKDPTARPDADTVRGLLRAALTPSAPAAEPTSRMSGTAWLTARMAGPQTPGTPRTAGISTTSQTAEATAPAAGHEAWEVPARPVPPASRVPVATVPAAREGGTATVVPPLAPSVPFPRRRALVALAVVALLSGPVVALAQRPGSSLAELPAAAGGTRLFATTPKAATATAPRTGTQKAVPTTSSTPPGEQAGTQAAAPQPPAASRPQARASVRLRAADHAGRPDAAPARAVGGASGKWNDNRGGKHAAKDHKKAGEKKGKQTQKHKTKGGKAGKHGHKHGGGGKHGG